jgi:hypothetical protein
LHQHHPRGASMTCAPLKKQFHSSTFTTNLPEP